LSHSFSAALPRRLDGAGFAAAVARLVPAAFALVMAIDVLRAALLPVLLVAASCVAELFFDALLPLAAPAFAAVLAVLAMAAALRALVLEAAVSEETAFFALLLPLLADLTLAAFTS